MVLRYYTLQSLSMSKAFCCALQGIDAVTITVEVHVFEGKTQLTVIGLPDNAVKESLSRIESAILSSNFWMPAKRVVFNLSPAEMKKTGAGFDLVMAAALLAATDQLPNGKGLHQYIIIGELALDGAILPVKGILPAALHAWKAGFEGVIVPGPNAEEAGMVNKIKVYAANHLKDVVKFFSDTSSLELVKVNTREKFFETHNNYDIDYSDVKGQEPIKRALGIAAAGGHNAILIGPPGSGKSMLAQRLPTILPALTLEEALETTKIYSVSGKNLKNTGLLNKRPFRAPHHTISNVALVGGGSIPQPGEISLAHNGVLFLDELPEFSRSVLEVMRQPLEERKVTISRSLWSLEFPANFMLLASMNPCPCGYHNHQDRACICSSVAVQKYLGKISGPLMDRIDLQIEVKALSIHQLSNTSVPQSSATIREKVLLARERQNYRFTKANGIYTNAQMTGKQLSQFCKLDTECEGLLYNALQKLKLSARAYDRILKVGRTIADLEDSEDICIEHLSEAIKYRSLDKEGLTDTGNVKKNSR